MIRTNLDDAAAHLKDLFDAALTVGWTTMIRTTLTDATEHLEVLVDAALRGEEVLITVGTTEAPRTIRLTVVQDADERRRKPQFGAAKGMFDLADDFFEPLEDFKEYMD